MLSEKKSKEFPNTYKEELEKEKTFYCTLVVNDLEEISSEISRLKELGVSIDIINKIFKTTEQLESKNLNFDPKTSILSFRNKEILISRGKDSDSHYLLKTIFKDVNKIWNYDEIVEELDPMNNAIKPNWRKFYNAVYSINKKIASETTIKNFLEGTSKTVQINKAYV